MQLNNGELALFDPSNTTPTSVNFIYTVQPGDSSNDLQVTGLVPNGGTITGSDGGLLAGNVAGTSESWLMLNPRASPSILA